MTTFTTEDRLRVNESELLEIDRIRILFQNLVDDCHRVAKEADIIQIAVRLGTIAQQIQGVSRDFEEYKQYSLEHGVKL